MRRRFVDSRYPRVQMLAILILSGAGAFLTSFALLEAGLTEMWFRYLTASLVGYAVFLGLIRLWISWQRGRWRDLDVPDLGATRAPQTSEGSLFGGGRSGGGGGDANWLGAKGSAGDTVSVADLDVGELWPVVLALVCAVAGVIALGYVIYVAPVLLAEVAIDAAVVTAVYGKLRKEDARVWFESAFRHTWLPALAVSATTAVAGFLLQRAAPTAMSIGGILRQLAQ